MRGRLIERSNAGSSKDVMMWDTMQTEMQYPDVETV
jgi:hypothetical protein